MFAPIVNIPEPACDLFSVVPVSVSTIGRSVILVVVVVVVTAVVAVVVVSPVRLVPTISIAPTVVLPYALTKVLS